MLELGDGATNRGSCLMTHVFHDRLTHRPEVTPEAASPRPKRAAFVRVKAMRNTAGKLIWRGSTRSAPLHAVEDGSPLRLDRVGLCGYIGSTRMGRRCWPILDGCRRRGPRGGARGVWRKLERLPGNPAQNAAWSPPPPRVALRTPGGAVQSYIEGVKTAHGGVIAALDENLRQKIIKAIVRTRISEAGSSCAQAMARLVGARISLKERNAKLPIFHAKTTGNRAVVKYIGTYTHHPHTFTLVKQGPGWLIDKITESR